jgi:hypothetical protein
MGDMNPRDFLERVLMALSLMRAIPNAGSSGPVSKSHNGDYITFLVGPVEHDMPK